MKTKTKYKFWPSVIAILIVCIIVAIVGHYNVSRSKILSPISQTYAQESIPTPTPLIIMVAYEDEMGDPIIDEISRVFKNEGTKTVAKAIMCFYTESKLNPNAYNFNSNGTGDYNIAQINSVHISKYGDKFMHDWKENIRIAYKIYKEQGWKPWYGSGCR